MVLYARRSLKNEDGYMEAEITDFTIQKLTFVDSTGLTHNNETSYEITDKFIIKGKIFVIESSLNVPLFDLMINERIPYLQFRNPCNYNSVYIPDSVHMISKSKRELEENWNKYFEEVEQRMKSYASLFHDKRYRYHKE